MIARLLLRMLALYPASWRRRYGAELADLIVTLHESGRRDALSLAVDIAIGAIDAHVSRRHALATLDPALRRGVLDGLLVAAFIAIVAVLMTVVFPGNPNASDDDMPGPLLVGGAYVTILALLAVIGARGRRRSAEPTAGLKAGAAAGLVIAVMIIATYLAIDNLFLDIVSRQHDKAVAFAASGWSSMRAYVTVSLLRGLLFLGPALTAFGALLGFVGGQFTRIHRAG